MFRRRFRVWSFLGAMICVAATGGGIAYWVKSNPKQKTFVDYPTSELHATCWLKDGEYGEEETVFLTIKQIDELKEIVRSGNPWLPSSSSRGPPGQPIFDAHIQFLRDDRRLNHLLFISDSFVTVDDGARYYQRLQIERADYAQFLFHCFETYRQKRLQWDESRQ